MTASSATSGSRVLAAAAIVAAVLGTVHGFSVFLEPLGAKFSAPRSYVSLTYSMALVALTIAVLQGYRIYSRTSAARLVMIATFLAAAGAILAGLAPTLWLVWVGYSLIFGAANGLGYGFSLQIAAQENSGRESWAMGVVTAAYALGALIAPAAFVQAMGLGGFAAAMALLAAVLVVCGIGAAFLMHRAGARFRGGQVRSGNSHPPVNGLVPLWVGYGAGVVAGLMTIGHAAGISRALSPETAIWIAPAVVAICNLGGSFLAGWLGDRIAPAKLLIALPLVSGAAALALITWGAPMLYPALGAIGLAYGGIIAACPAAIAARFGMDDGPRVYGRVFTAWGFAGLAAPVTAAWLFDIYASYLPSLWLVVLLSVFAATFARKASTQA